MISKKYFASLFELVAVAYGTAFLGLVTAAGFDVMSLASWKAAAIAAVPAGLAALYGVVARLKGNFHSALAVDTRDTV